MPTQYKICYHHPKLAIDDFRRTLIQWAQNQATGYRTEAALANRQFVINEKRAKADSYEHMVKYLEGMEIRE